MASRLPIAALAVGVVLALSLVSIDAPGSTEIIGQSGSADYPALTKLTPDSKFQDMGQGTDVSNPIPLVPEVNINTGNPCFYAGCKWADDSPPDGFWVDSGPEGWVFIPCGGGLRCASTAGSSGGLVGLLALFLVGAPAAAAKRIADKQRKD